MASAISNKGIRPPPDRTGAAGVRRLTRIISRRSLVVGRWFVYLFPHDQPSIEPAARAVTPSNPTAAEHRTRGAAAPSGRRFLKSFFDPRGPHFWIVDRGGTPPTDGHKNFSFLTF